MCRLFKVLFITFLCFFMFNAAQAEILVDTGDYENSGIGAVLNSNQWLASQFSIGQAYNITDIYGWINPANTGSLTIALYGDDSSDIPNISSQYLVQQFSPDSTDADWYGLTGLNVPLAAGTYWVSFEVRDDDTNYGTMPLSFSEPLLNSAYFDSAWNDGEGRWVSYDDTPIGIKIYGNCQNSVPEPAVMLLLGIGLAGLAGVRRKI